MSAASATINLRIDEKMTPTSLNPLVTRRRIAPPALLFCAKVLACALLPLAVGLAQAPLCQANPDKTPKQNIRVETILTEDDQGDPLRFPSAVAFDRDQEEIYVINGGTGGIVIYGRDFFPHLFLGAGRGIDSPQSVFFDLRDGKVFVCQGRSAKHPPRLSVLNAAFFPVQEITFGDMPDGADFSPTRGVLGKTGLIYLTGNNTRGVLVLDNNGKFQRWLRPTDKIRLPNKEDFPGQEDGETSADPFAALTETDTVEETDLMGLPAELMPSSRNKATIPEDTRQQSPVLINDLTVDRDGHLFLLSEETSKVYVYTPTEKPLFSFGQKGGSSGKMSRPRGIAIDENKKSIYIVDYMRHTTLVYDLGGKYLFEFGGRGNGPLWFNFPTAIAVDRKGRLIIADLFNNRVQILKPEFDATFPVFQGIKQAPAGQNSTPAPAETSAPAKNE